ncbi:MAG: hypothetical protein K6U11_09670 [bacterium]|nr:hypothetical protein [bacterium]
MLASYLRGCRYRGELTLSGWEIVPDSQPSMKIRLAFPIRLRNSVRLGNSARHSCCCLGISSFSHHRLRNGFSSFYPLSGLFSPGF